MQTDMRNRFGLFLTVGQDGRRVADARLACQLSIIPGLLRTHLYTPASATDPYLDDGAPPELMLECTFGSIEPLEASLSADGPLATLLGSSAVMQQAMLQRHYAVPGPPPGAECCTYVVAYEGEADDPNAWLSHYLAHHLPLMARFPEIRAIMVATRIDWCSGVGWQRANAFQRNRVVFDSEAALGAALASPVRHEMRADFHRLPPFHGRVTHYPMTTRTIIAQGAPL